MSDSKNDPVGIKKNQRDKERAETVLLIQKVIDEINAELIWPPMDGDYAASAACAAIAAVLDDLMADPVLERQEWHAVHKWLATKRRELGLASPTEPGDAPNAPSPRSGRGIG